MSQAADLTDAVISILLPKSTRSETRDRVDVTDFGAWQGRAATARDCISSRVTAISAQAFSGFMPEYSLVGRQDMGNFKS